MFCSYEIERGRKKVSKRGQRVKRDELFIYIRQIVCVYL